MRFDSICKMVVSVTAISVYYPFEPCHAFVHSSHRSNGFELIQQRTTPFVANIASSTQRRVMYNDFEDFSFFPQNNDKNEDKKNCNDSSSSSDLYAALRARQASLEDSPSSSLSSSSQKATDPFDNEAKCLENWRNAQCQSTVRLTLDDWIRRIAVDTYPLVVCGSSSGSLYLADLNEGEELDCAMNVHLGQTPEDRDQFESDPRLDSTALPDHLREALSDLYGKYDGGGIVALAMKDDWIVSSGREGGVHLCRIVGNEQDVYKGSRGGTSRQTKLSLQRLGKLRGLDEESKIVVTSMAFDSTGILWISGYDGVLRGYDYEEVDEEDRPIMLRQKQPTIQSVVGSPIINLMVHDEIGCGVACTLDGIILFSLEDGEILAKWNPFMKKLRREIVRSAIIVKDQSPSGNEDIWSVVCGGSRGSLFQRTLNVDNTNSLSEKQPFLDQSNGQDSTFPVKMRPNHLGPVVALASPAPGLLVSGALDGSMRVWDYSSFGPGNDEDDEDDDEDDDEMDVLEAQYDDVSATESRPQCLYALSGYKVWLGSVFANSGKLVSDGADNTIIVHSFEDEEEVIFSEEDEEDDSEGFI